MPKLQRWVPIAVIFLIGCHDSGPAGLEPTRPDMPLRTIRLAPSLEVGSGQAAWAEALANVEKELADSARIRRVYESQGLDPEVRIDHLREVQQFLENARDERANSAGPARQGSGSIWIYWADADAEEQYFRAQSSYEDAPYPSLVRHTHNYSITVEEEQIVDEIATSEQNYPGGNYFDQMNIDGISKEGWQNWLENVHFEAYWDGGIYDDEWDFDTDVVSYDDSGNDTGQEQGSGSNCHDEYWVVEPGSCIAA